ncbi:hypothetical protein FQN54_004807 [Arachnomyces sp. PD_36]|nr:hypothetical protein FQN54_004807 [Arachnomyces sp. PD_36]
MQKLAPRINESDDLVLRPAGAEGTVGSGPSPVDETPELAFHTRRPHHKSRLGCAVCKKRRCDEKKPSCGRCEYRGATCVYEKPEQISRNRKSSSPRERGSSREHAEDVSSVRTASPVNIMISASNVVAETAIRTFLQGNNAHSGRPSGTETSWGSSSPQLVESLRHFDMFTSDTLGAPIARGIIKSKVLPLASSAPYLMHSIIATSISHLRHLQPITHNATHVSEAYHWQQAVTLFRKEMNAPIKLENMDSMISTCMMLAVLSYTSDSHDPSASWVFSPHAKTSWLFINGGLNSLMDTYAPVFAQSVWLPILVDAKDFTGSEFIQNPGRDGIAADFADLCCVNDSSTHKNNPYHEPLRTLTALMQLEFVSANYSRFVFFMRSIRGEYRELLKEKDPRALLILGHWFAILCGIDQWWIRDRVKLECRAVCTYLEHNDDSRIVKLLAFPAEACGYALSPQKPDMASLGLGENDLAFAPGPQFNISPLEYETP